MEIPWEACELTKLPEQGVALGSAEGALKGREMQMWGS